MTRLAESGVNEVENSEKVDVVQRGREGEGKLDGEVGFGGALEDRAGKLIDKFRYTLLVECERHDAQLVQCI
jgi:hypothetical protein